MERIRQLSKNVQLLTLLVLSFLGLALLMQGISVLRRLDPQPADITQLVSASHYATAEKRWPTHPLERYISATRVP